MKIIKPKRLRKGDTIGIIAPASSPDDLSKLEQSIRYFESLGYKIETGENVASSRGYLAGKDEERLSDFHAMFKSKKISAIFCARGGYGSGRLLDKIDYRLVRNNPKIFVGYSDITQLQSALLTKCGLLTFAGPMPVIDFGGQISTFTEERFWEMLTTNKKIGKLLQPENEKLFPIIKGDVKARLYGGNLSNIVSLIGTDYLPFIKDKILFLEETGELPYRVDRMFNHLRLAKMLSTSRAVLLGAFVDCHEHDYSKRSLTLGEVIQDYFSNSKNTVMYNLKHGHLKDNLTLPIGGLIKIHSARGYIEITEGLLR
ncbi:MAG: LD-carboxypeptidase [Ignavibacteriales bacterium]|nr:MAG: LD-carboxypeptidase [Ignavibacteriales bacterium]